MVIYANLIITRVNGKQFRTFNADSEIVRATRKTWSRTMQSFTKNIPWLLDTQSRSNRICFTYEGKLARIHIVPRSLDMSSRFVEYDILL